MVVGNDVGAVVGNVEGAVVGFTVVGSALGEQVGTFVGLAVGLIVGIIVGEQVGGKGCLYWHAHLTVSPKPNPVSSQFPALFINTLFSVPKNLFGRPLPQLKYEDVQSVLHTQL